jgi:hypothetical protein
VISAIHTEAYPLNSLTHPAALRLALASGALLDNMRYEIGDIESGVFSRKNASSYLYHGSTARLSAQNYDMVYGEFDSDLNQVWLKQLNLANREFGSIAAKGSGYVLHGITATNNGSDFLLGSVGSTGTIPGCSEIEDVTPTVTSPTITASPLDWSPAAATVSNKGAITAADFDNLSNAKLAVPTATTICD